METNFFKESLHDEEANPFHDQNLTGCGNLMLGLINKTNETFREILVVQGWSEAIVWMYWAYLLWSKLCSSPQSKYKLKEVINLTIGNLFKQGAKQIHVSQKVVGSNPSAGKVYFLKFTLTIICHGICTLCNVSCIYCVNYLSCVCK